MAWAELSDVRCYYEVRGRGDPLLLVPGLGGTCRMWDSVAPLLADKFSVITFDNRGLGQSLARQPARNLRHLAADMVELLDHLQLDRVHVLGLSLGGIIAQRFAMDHGPRIDRLVLISCSDQFTPYLRQITLLLAHAIRRASPRRNLSGRSNCSERRPFLMPTRATLKDRSRRSANVPRRAGLLRRSSAAWPPVTPTLACQLPTFQHLYLPGSMMHWSPTITPGKWPGESPAVSFT